MQLSADFVGKRDTNWNHPLVFAIQSKTHSKPFAPLHINTPGRLLQACFIRAWRRANVERVASSLRCESHSNELESHCSRVLIQAVVNRCWRTTNHMVHTQSPINPRSSGARPARTHAHSRARAHTSRRLLTCGTTCLNTLGERK